MPGSVLRSLLLRVSVWPVPAVRMRCPWATAGWRPGQRHAGGQQLQRDAGAASFELGEATATTECIAARTIYVAGDSAS